MSLEERYAVTPQMRAYDGAGRVWVPYLMYFHEPEYRSEVMNTDSRGFRFVVGAGDRVVKDFERRDEEPICVLAGGSTAFGVGATSDAATIPSLLTRGGEALWLNFGGRAFSSTQELLLFMSHTPRLSGLRRVVILSGVNNLLLFYLSHEYARDYGSFFSATELRRLLVGEAPAPSKGGGLRAIFKSLGLGASEPLPAPPRPQIMREIVDHDAEKQDLLHVLDRDIHNWQLFGRAMGFEVTYVLQPLASWVDKRPSPEEERLFNELDDHQGEAWRRVLREKMSKEQHAWFAGGLAEICRARGVRFLDMNEKLSTLGLDGRWIFVDRVHLTDEGNEHVARILREEHAA